ncbi:MAG TPA: CoA transferase [Rhizobiaceae bacterium]|nr:CoA transferase [Rhizobiaceae bacterium]
MSEKKGPLAGLRVLDASMGAVGPWAGVLLGQLGADVVKLESPQGDFIRNITPRKKGLSTTYISMNFNKRGIVLDLKREEERETVHKLAAQADVFIENFRPGVADRIGVGYAQLSAINPRLIYASASGFGRKGPMVGIGATDPHLQPFTGSCSVNGTLGGKLQRWRWYGHFDCTTAMCIAQGVLSALLERNRTGKGKLVEITMIEAALTLQRVRLAEHLSGATPVPMGSAITYLVPDQAFQTEDIPLAVTASSCREWRALCQAIGRPELTDDARFARNPDRIRNREALLEILDAVFAKRPAQYWLDVLRRAKVPCALFTSYDEFRHNVHYLENEMLTTFRTEDWGAIDMAGVPWRFDRTPAELRPGTQPGAHTTAFAGGDWPAPTEA